MQCQCTTQKGLQCKLKASKKPNANPDYCTRHQGCTNPVPQSPKKETKKKSPKKLVKKVSPKISHKKESKKKDICGDTQNDKLFYYSKSRDTFPGKGTNEEVQDPKNYKELSKIKDWRKILSNFYEAPFVYNDVTYNTVEHAFQAAKIGLVNDEDAYTFTMDSESALGMGSGEEARKNRKMHVLNKVQIGKWNKIKDIIMEDIVREKFNQVEEAKRVLLLTQCAELWHTVMRSKPIRSFYLENVRDELRV